MKKPLLYLLPGLDGTGKLLKNISSRLENNFRPIIISYPEEKLSYNELYEYVLGELPKKERFYLLGESFGGPLAVQIALEKQHQIEKLILCATFINNPIYIPESLVGFTQYLPLEYLPIELLESFLFSIDDDKEIKNAFKEVFKNLDMNIIRHRMSEVLKTQVPNNIEKLKNPILYLKGQKDFLILSHNYDRLKKILPQISSATFDTGHMVLQTRVEESAKAIEDFILT